MSNLQDRYQITITKIIAYYGLFYAAVKVYAIFQGLWFWPNLLIAVFLGIMAAVGFYIVKKEKYNWYFIVVCIILVSALRYYESQLVPYLQQVFQ
ncbi:SRPBCC family protein [Galbibacter mesophilus]|uniref:hypothetical protein n=1 Tax=Galbibacter mesophilus TaxID=379069 RepID=UPI00191E48F2|nr:hypothetical protein [Galbibacter mesophilus]MCM5663721.1 hypothetical protein [Galbibacter mesophilus]